MAPENGELTLNFVDEMPRKTRKGTVRVEMEAIKNELILHPGKPALLWDDLNPSTASMRARTLRQDFGLDAVARGGSVYAQYISKANSVIE